MKRIKLKRTLGHYVTDEEYGLTYHSNYPYPSSIEAFINIPKGARILARSDEEVVFEVKGKVLKGTLCPEGKVKTILLS